MPTGMSDAGVVTLLRNNSCIDATILTKDQTLMVLSTRLRIPLSKIGYIGDEVSDLPVFATPGLGFAGAPSNAQKRVVEYISQLPNGYLSTRRVFGGFLDFYEQSGARGMTLVVSDKDGVLKEGADMRWGQVFPKLLREMGAPGKPLIAVLTGSSYQQNLPFMEAYGLDASLRANPNVGEFPELLLLEGGARSVNVLTGECVDHIGAINPELLAHLKNGFEPECRRLLEQGGLDDSHLAGWSTSYGDQRGKIYVPSDKVSMVTINIPREFRDGRKYRKTPQSEHLRDRILDVMRVVAEKQDIPYLVL
jgi:hypothetical protein